METDLRKSEERYRTLYQSAEDAFLTIQYTPGEEPLIIDCNTRAVEMFTIEQDKLIGKTLSELLPAAQPDGSASHEKIDAMVQSVINGESMTFELELSDRDDASFPAEISLKRIDIMGRTYIQTVIQNITQRKCMEDLLRESGEYARSFIDSSQDCVCNLTVEGKIMSMNPAGYALLGFDDSDEMAGISCTDYVTENREEVEHAIKRAANGENASVPYKTVSKKGREVWWDAKLTPLRDLDGRIKSIMKVSRDITSYKKLENSLLNNQSLLIKDHEELSALFKLVEKIKKEWENTMDCMGDMIIIADDNGKISRYNKTLLKFVNRPGEEVIGRDWEDLIYEMDLEAVSFLAGSIELMQKSTDRWFTLNSYPFKENSIKLSGAVITIHEITEAKKITGKLERAYSDLKASQSAILQREKMASIGQLAAGVAHEINNPMGFITSNIGTLRKYLKKLTEFMNEQTEACTSLQQDDLMDRLREKRNKLKVDYILDDLDALIEESLDGAERVKRIVQNLKTFSRVDDAEYKKADINECIESTLQIVWNELKYKATVQKDYQLLPPVTCYPQQLNQVFMNLLVNAAHAIEKQGNIRIRTWNGNGFINISIADTGCGIPEDNIDKIFEPFFTTKEVGKGTGLGLSISYEIIKKHKGEINIKSKIGEGTEFTIRIPLLEDISDE